MSTHIKKLEDLLLVNVPADLADTQILGLRRAILAGIERERPRWLLLDFSEVEICDSFFGRFVETMVSMARLMGMRVVVCGLSDAVVETMVEMGFELPDVTSLLDIDDALAFTRRARAVQPR
ncbi:STAS domain-containing protein [Sandaracinus amylolyticus]|uniref:STAS domain-containing protein n=1 Tax=Sandaracinus amylolyticus TaxID=927083 RepID=UPI001F2233D1|nr:STAS domain-containing protein [Sandaracinus amylolyticus]UJR86644.1 Hypothetical protein I5071_87450 [Sandaracinus amylolyticus]